MKTILTLFISFVSTLTFSQTSIPSYGQVTNEEINLKECSFDKSANAIVLLDIAQSTYSEEYELITTRRIKLKILKEAGLEYGNVTLYYQHKEDFENLTDIQAIVHTIDDKGVPNSIELDKKSIFKNRVNEIHSEVKFALPNVKVGTIIEYSYVSKMKSWDGLNEWEFQREIPTLYSKYDLNILPGLVFQYKIHKNTALPIDIQAPRNEGKISYAMSNIPGLREEPYMDAPKDYKQRVEFQISEFTTSYGAKRKFTNTWADLNREMLSSPMLGRAIEKNLGKDIEILKQVAIFPSEFDKMKAIHNYVRKSFTWNGRHGFYAIDGIKKAWDSKTGSAAEINLTMLNLLREAGLNADPLLVSERDNGKVSADYPFAYQFNLVVAFVTIGDKKYVLDGTDKLTPPELIPFNLVNTNAFLLSKKNSRMIQLNSQGKTWKTTLSITCDLDENGIVRGKAYENNFDYVRYAKLSRYNREGKTKYIEKYLLKEETDLVVDSLVVTNLDTDSLPFHQEYNFTVSTTANGNYRILPLNIFPEFGKNPFVSDIRFTNIDFGTPIDQSLTQMIRIPAGMKPEALPKNITLIMPDKSISLTRASVYDDKINTIVIRQRLEIAKPVFTSDEYASVKEFFKKMMDMLREPLVLKSK